MIYILTGEIRTGKTTALLNWVIGRADVDGLWCPDGKHGKRYFLKIKSQEQFELEVESESEDTITIGRFHFLKSAFEEANEFLIGLGAKKESRYVIIDELGKLELKGKGLHDPAKALIPEFMFNEDKHLILVVRESLLKDIINHYAISKYSVFEKEDLQSFS